MLRAAQGLKAVKAPKELKAIKELRVLKVVRALHLTSPNLRNFRRAERRSSRQASPNSGHGLSLLAAVVEAATRVRLGLKPKGVVLVGLLETQFFNRFQSQPVIQLRSLSGSEV